MRTHNAVLFAALLPLAALGLTSCASAITSDADLPTASSGQASGGPDVPSAAPATLPDGIPLPPNASLAKATAPISNAGKVRGWTAVALTPTGVNVAETVSRLRELLTGAGWEVSVKGSESTGVGIAAKSPAVSPIRWLNLSVTPPLPGSGPAVTYRFAQISAPISTTPPITPLPGSTPSYGYGTPEQDSP